MPRCLPTVALRRARQGKQMEKFQEIVRAHDSFDMKLKRLVPGGGAAFSYTAHFRCAGADVSRGSNALLSCTHALQAGGSA